MLQFINKTERTKLNKNQEPTLYCSLVICEYFNNNMTFVAQIQTA